MDERLDIRIALAKRRKLKFLSFTSLIIYPSLHLAYAVGVFWGLLGDFIPKQKGT